MKNLGKGIGRAVLTFAFVFGLYAATTISAEAQYRNDGQYQRRDRNRGYDRDRDRDWRRNREWRRDRNRRNDRHDSYGYGNDTYNRNRGYGNNGGYGYGGYGNANQYELNRGYQQGLETGSSDAQRGQSYSPQRSRHYKNASSQAFLNGFVRGYDAGYRQYAGYDNGTYRRNSGLGGILGGIFGRP
jgi:hypothetical protein